MSGARISYHNNCDCKFCKMRLKMANTAAKLNTEERVNLELLFMSWEKLEIESKALEAEKSNWRKEDAFNINDAESQGTF